MQFRILGPVEVLDDAGETVAIGGARERALLALLLLFANQVVSTDRLVDGIWGERHSDGVLHALRVHISRLRRTLRSAGGENLLLTRPHGYVVNIDRHNVDSTRFEDLLLTSRQRAAVGDHPAAAAAVRGALALWHGPALSGLGAAPFVPAHAARLEETRLAAVEQRIEHDLSAGRHAEIIGELGQLITEHPLREGLWRARMLALYRCRRQAEALQAYSDLRDLLRGELGLEPSAALTDLHRAMLRHEPRLEPPAAPTPASDLAGGGRPSTRYARQNGINIAYQVVGDGPVDLVLVPGFVSNVDLYWDDAAWRQILMRLSVGRRLILWDKRGTGQSDPVHRVPSLEERVEDLLAVMNAASCERATLLGISEGGPMSLLLAADHPQHVSSLILYGVTPRFSRGPGWPWGWSHNSFAAALAEIDADWGSGALLDLFAPASAGDEAARCAWGRAQRAGASPAMARAVMEAMFDIDCRDILPRITVPTLVLQRAGDRCSPLPAAQYLAEQIPVAQLVQMPGENHLITLGPLDPILDEIDRFLLAVPPTPAPTSVQTETVAAYEFSGDIAPGTRKSIQAALAPCLGEKWWE